jgi:hypothetical protein
MVTIAHQFHEILTNIYNTIYDLNEKHDRQKYDVEFL